MNGTPLLLLYAPSLRSNDGTSVQLRRLLSGHDRPVWHIHGPDPSVSAQGYPANCLSLEVPLEPRYPFRRGAGFLRRAWRRWRVPRFVRTRLAEASRKSGMPPPRVGYVVIYDELNAVFAVEALKAAGVDRYVLHLMDLFHTRFDPRAQPVLAGLIANASVVLTVSSRLAEEIAPAARQRIEVMPLATGFVAPTQGTPAAAAPYLMMSGALYAADARKLDYLYEKVVPAWTRLKRELPAIEWLYSGADANSFSPALRAVVKNCGMLPQEAWCRTLASARCTLQPIVHHADTHYRFSVPSRMVDYLAAGIPILSPSSPGTATGDFLNTFQGKGVLLADSEEEVFTTLRQLFQNDGFHREQAEAARAAAPQFSIARIRSQLHGIFERLES